MKSQFTVRPATLDDATAIGTVQTRSWKTTYSGIVDQSFLDKLEVEPRISSAQKRFHNVAIRDFVLVDNFNNEVVGFVVIGPNREKNVDSDGEMYAIYLLKDYQGRGGGKLLFETAVKEAQKMDFKKMMVSVLEDNVSSRKFYEAMGAKLIGADHVDLEERRYITATYLWTL